MKGNTMIEFIIYNENEEQNETYKKTIEKVMMNYELLKNNNVIVKKEDIFSIRGIGKFKVVAVTATSEKYIVILHKYI